MTVRPAAPPPILRASRSFCLPAFVILALVAPTWSQAAAQVPTGSITLSQALQLAESSSEQLAMARAGLTRAEGEKMRARSEYFPQLFAELGYVRTLQSEFSSMGGAGGPGGTAAPPAEPCPTFAPDPSLPTAERLGSVERALECFSNEDPFAAFGSLPFGRAHRYSLDLTGSQTVFSGGRVQAQNRMAEAGRRSAEIAVESAHAELALQVAEAYFDAQLADRLLAVAESTLDLAESTLEDVRLAHELGEEAEFELLRAQVTRDTQRPVVIQRRADRELAHMALRRLVGAPLDAELALTTPLEDVPSTAFTSSIPSGLAAPHDTATDLRAPVRQEEQVVEVQEAQRAIARAQRLPAVSLSTTWTRVAYPESGFPSANDFRPNWTVSARVSMPLFTGGRITGDERVAQAGADEARARRDLTREAAAVDTRHALDQLRAAEAAWEASSGTVEQAQRAYQIAEIRFVEGLATQLDVMDARILLEQAGANRALSARNLQVARLRVALLPLLPIAFDQGGAPPMTPAPGTPRRDPIGVQPQPATGRGGLVTGSGGG